MSKIFSHNLLNLRLANMAIVILAICWSIFPIMVEKNTGKAGIYLATALAALILLFVTNLLLLRIKHGKKVHDLFIYTLTTLYYINIMFFGIYLGVWSNPEIFAVAFMSFLICALFLFINPPLYNLFLTLGALIVFIVSTILVKTPKIWVFDLSNALIAGCISLFFGWQITKLRLVSELNTCKLEDERNTYYNQSTLDELTGLRNRRDFFQTFQRYLFSHRSSDDWLCIAIADIDFFKNYNDHYGHPKGDECLCSIGAVLNSFRDVLSVYAARVGGEEFALLWFQKKAEHVDTVVARINDMIKDMNIPHERSGVASYVTLSIGIYVVRCGTFSDIQALYNMADKALYTAKQNGRNCAIVCGNEIPQYRIPG